MTVEEQIHEMGVKARAAATAMRAFTTAQKNAALVAIADALDAAKPQIDAANAEDVAAAKANGLAPAMVDRLTLTPSRFKSMVDGVRYIVELDQRAAHAEQACEQVRHDLGCVESSVSFKAGRALTAPLRIARDRLSRGK